MNGIALMEATVFIDVKLLGPVLGLPTKSKKTACPTQKPDEVFTLHVHTVALMITMGSPKTFRAPNPEL